MIIIGTWQCMKPGDVGHGIYDVTDKDNTKCHDQPWIVLKEATFEAFLLQYMRLGGDPSLFSRDQFSVRYFYEVSTD